jgi:small-conductance mechanosensitive channel
MLGNSTETFLPKLIDIGVDFAKGSLRIVLIIIAAYVGLRLLRFAFNRLETLLVRATSAAEVIPGAATKRIRTLMSVLWTIVVGLVWFVAVLTTLGQIGVNVTPVLAGAGIVGLAIGFGAQNLVKDLVSGFFLILENQVRVGDVAIINGTGGLVEAISFRTIVLRDEAAVVHVFPNGAITTLSIRTASLMSCAAWPKKCSLSRSTSQRCWNPLRFSASMDSPNQQSRSKPGSRPNRCNNLPSAGSTEED